jgi:hypothetical protein
MNPDGISYLDIADAFRRMDWHRAISAHWSPLYPCVLGLALSLAKPSSYWEFPLTHLVNFGCFLISLACFEFLLRQLRAWRLLHQTRWTGQGLVALPESVWVALGYTTFLYGVMSMISIAPVTPDLLVAGAVFMAAGLALRIQNGGDEMRSFLALGAVLGLGYLAKAPLLVAAPIFFGVAAYGSRSTARETFPRVASGLAVFIVLAGLFVLPLSRLRGRISFGESGRLNYIWRVMEMYPFPYESVGRSPYGIPRHPYPVLVDHPTIYQYSGSVGGTYPVWYDPAYWYEGVHLRWDIVKLVKAVRYNLGIYFEIYWAQMAFLLGLVVLYFKSVKGARRMEGLRESYPLVIPAAANLAMFGLVLVQTRYVGAFVTLLWLGLFSGIRIPSGQKAERWARTVVLFMLVCALVPLARYAAATARRGLKEEWLFGNPPEGPVYWQVGEALKQAGLREGDWIATFCDSYTGYWARLARVRIMAESKDPDQFWRASPDAQAKAMEAMRAMGIKAVVAKREPSWPPAPGWQPVGHTDYFIHDLMTPGTDRESSSSSVRETTL